MDHNRRLFKIILVLMLLSATMNMAFGKQKKEPPTPSSILVEVESGKVLHSNRANSPVSIASMTKLMTVLAVIEASQDLAETLTVTGRERSSRIRPGWKISRQDLIELTLVNSDNLAARTLLANYPGGAAAGLEAMNRIADRLGARDTTYVGPSGLLDGNKSTVSDIVKITTEAARHKIFTDMANKERSDIRAERRVSRTKKIMQWIQGNNTNPFTHQDTDFKIIAAKTGLTTAAGWCLTMMIQHQSRTYVLVTTGNRNKEERKRMADFLIALATDQRYQVNIGENLIGDY